MQAEWILWQLLDSALPTGGFVASSGLEAAVQVGLVKESSFVKFLQDSVSSYGNSTLPFVSDAHEIVIDGVELAIKSLIELDLKFESTCTNHVTRRASTTQGGALLLLYSKSFDQDEVMKQFKLQVRRGTTKGHLSTTFGIICKCLGIDKQTTQRVFLFLYVRAIVSAAVRLNLVGPYYAQKVLTHIQPSVDTVLSNCKDLSSDNARQTNPLLDIVQGVHDCLYSRLFNS